MWLGGKVVRLGPRLPSGRERRELAIVLRAHDNSGLNVSIPGVPLFGHAWRELIGVRRA